MPDRPELFGALVDALFVAYFAALAALACLVQFRPGVLARLVELVS